MEYAGTLISADIETKFKTSGYQMQKFNLINNFLFTCQYLKHRPSAHFHLIKQIPDRDVQKALARHQTLIFMRLNGNHLNLL